MNYNFNSGYGQILANQIAASVGPVFGRIMVVVGASDVSVKEDMMKETFVPDPMGKVRFYATLEAAYAAATSNADDIILLSGHSTHTIAAGIAWSKSRIHVIGMDGGNRLIQQGAKVQSTDGAADAYVIKDTGTRNTFENIKFIQADTNAAAIHVLELGGEGSVYKNCSAVFGVIDNLDLTTASEVVLGTDSATIIDCEFGTETLLTSAARAVLTIDQVVTNQEFKSNRIKNLTLVISSSDADALLFKVAANTDVLFTNLFENTKMMASLDSAGGIALTIAGASAGSLVKGTINFANLAIFNCASFMTTADQVKITGNIPVAATSGIAVTPA